MSAPAMSFGEIFKSGEWEGQQVFSDGILQTDDGTNFKIHRVVLSQRSGYFRACFSFNLKQETVFIPNIDRNILESILLYIYTDTITLNKKNVWDLMIASDYLLLDDLLKSCRTFAIRSMTIENCFSSLPVTFQIERMSIKEDCVRYALVNFDDILEASNVGLAGLSFEILKTLLKSSSLNVSSERSVWEAIVTWTNANISIRRQYVPALLSHIRLEEEDEDLAAEILSHILITSNRHCQKSLRMVQKKCNGSKCNAFSQLAKSKLISCHNSSSPYSLRIPSNLYIIARHSITASTYGSEIFLTYDSKLDFWRLIGETNFFIDAMVQIGQHIYLFNAWENINLIFDILEEDFLPISIPAAPCQNSFMITLNGKLFSIGGSNRGNGLTNMMHSYDFERNRWERIDLAHYMIIYGAVTLNDLIYILGLTDLGFGPILVFRAYNPQTENWTVNPIPNVYREECSVAAYHGQVFVIAGENNGQSLKSVEVYNPQQDLWMALPDLPFQYFFPKAVVVDDKLIVYEYNNEDTRFYDVSPPIYWKEDSQLWQIIDESSPLHCIERYSFLALDDRQLVSDIIDGNRGPGFEWERILPV